MFKRKTIRVSCLSAFLERRGRESFWFAVKMWQTARSQGLRTRGKRSLRSALHGPRVRDCGGRSLGRLLRPRVCAKLGELSAGFFRLTRTLRFLSGQVQRVSGKGQGAKGERVNPSTTLRV